MQISPILSLEMKNYRWLLPSLLGTDFLVRLLVLIRPLKYLDGLTIPDDAYYSLTIARNIAEGLGPYYFIDYTNGFQPLYVFLAAPLFKLFAGDYIMPVYGSLFMLVIFDILSLYLLCKLTSSFARTKFALFFCRHILDLQPLCYSDNLKWHGNNCFDVLHTSFIVLLQPPF